MGQTTRSQGISFTYEMWEKIDERCAALKCGRSQYFQMLVEKDLKDSPDIFAHKRDGKWHFFPETEALAQAAEAAGGYGKAVRRTKKSPLPPASA